MADIEKKIKINVESNISNINRSFNALSKHLTDMAKSVKKFGDMLSGETFNKLSVSIKNSLGPLKDFGKQLRKMSQDVAQMEALAKALNKIARETKKIEKAKGGKPKIDESFLTPSFDKYDIKLGKIARGESRLKSLSEIGSAIRSGSLLNIGSTLASKAGESIISKTAYQSEKDKIASNTKKMNQLKNELVEGKDTLSAEEIKSKQKEYKNLAAENKKLDSVVSSGTKLNVNKFNFALAAATTIAKGFGDVIKSTTGISLSLADAFKDVISTAGRWMDMTSGMATYATGSSLITNANARRTQLKYGLSESQTFAFDEATKALNIQSDEDIAYMNSRQKEVFSAFMDKYSKFYDEMQSSGVLDNIQQMQLDFYMFKQELAMDFMNWFAENKDWILNAIKGILNVMKGIFTIIGWIVEPIVKLANFFGGKYNTSELSDTLSASAGYSDSSTTNNMSNKTNNINVTMTNNATGVLSSQNALEEFYKEQMERTAKQLALELE